MLLLAGFERFVASMCMFCNRALNLLKDLLTGATQDSCSFTEKVIPIQPPHTHPHQSQLTKTNDQNKPVLPTRHPPIKMSILPTLLVHHSAHYQPKKPPHCLPKTSAGRNGLLLQLQSLSCQGHPQNQPSLHTVDTNSSLKTKWPTALLIWHLTTIICTSSNVLKNMLQATVLLWCVTPGCLTIDNVPSCPI